MILKEFQMPLPFTVEEYYIGALYMCARGMAEDSTKDDGIEVLENIECEKDGRKGRYTRKMFHIRSYLPRYLQAVTPHGLFNMLETSTNMYPVMTTVYHASLLGDRFVLEIKSNHVVGDCDQRNALRMSKKDLKRREIDVIDIVKDVLDEQNDEPDFHPSCQPVPLKDDWRDTSNPMMTAYKSVKVKLAIPGIQGRAERFIVDLVRQVFLKYHRKCYAWAPIWRELTLEQIREIERDADGQTRSLHSESAMSN